MFAFFWRLRFLDSLQSELLELTEPGDLSMRIRCTMTNAAKFNP